MVVTTNGRLDMEAGLRPALRERELRTTATALLRHLGMADDGTRSLRLLPAARPGKIRVAVYDGSGAQNGIGRGPAWLRERLAREGDVRVELVGVPEILQGALDRADVFVLGGGFVGICAGACVGCNGSGKWDHLELLPVEVGATHLKCKTPLVWDASVVGAARVELADLSGGPSFKRMEPAADQVTVWDRFERDEAHPENGEVRLAGTPAIVSGKFGNGKVVLTSTHNERPPSPTNIFPGMVHWSARIR